MAVILDLYGNKIDSAHSTAVVDANNDATKTDTSNETQSNEKKDDALFIQTPIFLLFAEFLGFVSGFIEIAENWCKLSKPMPKPYQITMLEREARSIYDQMLKKWNEEEINKLYRNFYTCGLDELEADLILKRKRNGDDLPF